MNSNVQIKTNKAQLFVHREDLQLIIYYFIEKQLLSLTAEQIFKLQICCKIIMVKMTIELNQYALSFS